MKAAFPILGAALVLGACASHPDIYDRAYTTKAQFEQDAAGCKLLAETAGDRPIPNVPVPTPGYTATTTYTPSGATTDIEPDQSVVGRAAELANLVGGVANVTDHFTRPKKIVRLCMQAKGYTLRAQK
ncbi:MAG: hypothetical protein ABSD21_02895 [Rhizomicrobium sp.]|jgi:hypothetical protein